jgi:hypothetical protein
LPLKNILTGTAKRCSSRCKARGEQCLNPAAFGMAVCRYHGARRPETIRRGANHPQYRHGGETLEAKAERSIGLAELRDLEALSFAFGLATGVRWRGAKPKRVQREV